MNMFGVLAHLMLILHIGCYFIILNWLANLSNTGSMEKSACGDISAKLYCWFLQVSQLFQSEMSSGFIQNRWMWKMSGTKRLKLYYV